MKIPSPLQKKKLIAMALEASAKTIFRNHIYKFNHQVYKQQHGGPIGDDITRQAAEMVMFIFMRIFKKKMNNLALLEEVSLLKVYVDDIDIAAPKLPYGSQYAGGKLYIPGEGWRGRSPKGQKLSIDEKA